MQCQDKRLSFSFSSTVQLGICFILYAECLQEYVFCASLKSSEITTEDLRTCCYKLRQQQCGHQLTRACDCAFKPPVDKATSSGSGGYQHLFI